MYLQFEDSLYHKNIPKYAAHILKNLSCSSSRIFSRRAFSSGVLFLLAIGITSVILLLFYTLLEVYTKFGMESQQRIKIGSSA